MGMFSWDGTGTIKLFKKDQGFGYASSDKGDVYLPANAFKGNLAKAELGKGKAIRFDLGPNVPGKKSLQAKSWSLK